MMPLRLYVYVMLGFLIFLWWHARFVFNLMDAKAYPFKRFKNKLGIKKGNTE
jgi:hypothetical protein